MEVTALPHARHATIHGNLPSFLELLDAFARAIDLGDPGVPTFAGGLATQHQLAAIGYDA